MGIRDSAVANQHAGVLIRRRQFLGAKLDALHIDALELQSIQRSLVGAVDGPHQRIVELNCVSYARVI